MAKTNFIQWSAFGEEFWEKTLLRHKNQILVFLISKNSILRDKVQSVSKGSIFSIKIEIFRFENLKKIVMEMKGLILLFEESILEGIFSKYSSFYRDRSLMNKGLSLMSLVQKFVLSAPKDQFLMQQGSILTLKFPILWTFEEIFILVLLFDLSWNLIWNLSLWWLGSTLSFYIWFLICVEWIFIHNKLEQN